MMKRATRLHPWKMPRRDVTSTRALCEEHVAQNYIHPHINDVTNLITANTMILAQYQGRQHDVNGWYAARLISHGFLSGNIEVEWMDKTPFNTSLQVGVNGDGICVNLAVWDTRQN